MRRYTLLYILIIGVGSYYYDDDDDDVVHTALPPGETHVGPASSEIGPPIKTLASNDGRS